MRYPVLLALLAGPALIGCWSYDGDAPECTRESDFPRCTLGGSAVLTCVGGRQFIDRCPTGQRCLEILDHAGMRFSQCVHEDATVCNIETFVPVCADRFNLNNCMAPLGHLEAGHTFLDPCPAGTACNSGTVHDACGDPGAEPCDPQSFAGQCRGRIPLVCISAGMTEQQQPCAPGLTCKVGSEGAVCVDSRSEACDWDTFQYRCEDDAVVRCDYFTGFTELDPCGPDERCRESPTSAQCFGPDQPDCDPESFTSRCEGDQRVICSSGFGVEQPQVCATGKVCRVSAKGAHCVEPDALECDASGFVPYCNGEQQVLCSYYTGFTFELACAGDETCRMSDLGGYCVDPEAAPCDPATHEGSCDDGVAHFCNLFTGFTDTDVCMEAEVCAADETCVLGFCQHLAMCVDLSAPGCSEPAGISCRGRTVVSCFDGHELHFDCAEGQICVTDDGMSFRCE